MNQVNIEKLNEILDRGLCSGMGEADGTMCIEAAIAIASGEELNDSPKCVHRYVRRFSIRLNDARWPSGKERAAGLRRLALAQLGSVSWTDEQARGWVRAIVLRTIKEVLPIYLRATKLEESALECEAVIDLPGARLAAQRARAKARAAAAAAAAAAYAAAAAAADAAADAAAATDAAACAAAAAATTAAYAAADAAAYAARFAALELSAHIAAEECDRVSLTVAAGGSKHA